MHDSSPSSRLWSGTDALLLATAIVWGTNYSVIKVVLQKVPPLAFVAVRLTLASIVFLAAIAFSASLRARRARLRDTIAELTPGGHESLAILRTSRLSTRDWMQLALLGAVGHFLYQTLFIEGLARTSVANASIIIGCTPIVVAFVSAALGWERLGVMHWIGTALSFVGIYLVVGRPGVAAGAGGHASLTGDLLMCAGVFCWTYYTLYGRRLLRTHSPLVVTGYSMAIGTALFLVYSATVVRDADWSRLGVGEWTGVAYAAFVGMNISYVLWYAGVQRLGSARTALYSNLVPLFSLAFAAVWLGERIGFVKLAGAAAVLCGLALTRVQWPPPTTAQ